MPDRSVSSRHTYEICIQGRLSRDWSEWFGDMTVSGDGKGNTLLYGELADRAALYGVLDRLRDLGLVLLSVTRLDVPPDAAGFRDDV